MTELKLEPSLVADDYVNLLLFTRENPIVGHQIFPTSASISNSSFKSGKTFVLIPGWTAKVKSTVNQNLTAAFLVRGDYNVISKFYKITQLYSCYFEYLQSSIGLNVPAALTTILRQIALQTLVHFSQSSSTSCT